MDYEDAIGAPGTMTVHPTGSWPTVPTFSGAREYVPLDIRPYPERIEEIVRALTGEVAILRCNVALQRQEIAALRVQVAALEMERRRVNSYDGKAHTSWADGL